MICSIDYIEFYVSNASEIANFYKEILDFQIIAIGDSSTGLKDRTSYILKREESFLVFTSSNSPDSLISNYINKHGNFVRDIAFRVNKIQTLYEKLARKGANILDPPEEILSNNKKIIKARVGAFGDVIHSLIERKENMLNLPFYKYLVNQSHQKNPSLIKKIDHIAIALEPGTLEKWVKYYEDFFNFSLTHQENVYTGKSGMESMVVSSQNNQVKFPLVAPMRNSPKGQIDIFLEKNNGAGVQHLAFLTNDIVQVVKKMREIGVNFLEVPEAYYEKITQESMKNVSDKVFNDLKNLEILIESEGKSVLLQTFTKPFTQKPPFFIEIIERHNHAGFGSKNIKALFEAVERSQNKKNI